MRRLVIEVSVTALRTDLPSYLEQVRQGVEIRVTRHGKPIARIVPDQDAREAATARLLALRARCRIGDVLSPTGAMWDAEGDEHGAA